MSQNNLRETLISAWQRIRMEAETLQEVLRCQDPPPQDRYREIIERLTRQLKELTNQLLRWELIDAEVEFWLQRYLNIGIKSSALVRTIRNRHGDAWFDPRVIEEELEQEYGGDRAKKLSWQALVAQARRLVPYHAASSDLVRNPETLNLRCWLERDDQSRKATWLPYEAVQPLGALTQIARVLQDGADPATVKPAPWIERWSVDRESRRNVTGRWWELPPLRLRFYRNGRLDVRCETEQLARALAETLAQSPSPDAAEPRSDAAAVEAEASLQP
jgi:hypothetical protein